VKFVLVGTAYPHRGGIAHFVHLLAHTLMARGHDVQILSFTRQYPSILFPGTSQDDDGPPPDPPLDIHPMIDTINPISWGRAARWAVAQKPDLTVFKYWMPFFAPGYDVIVRRLNRKQVGRTCFLLDNVIPHEPRPGDRWLTKRVLEKVDTFIAQSAVVREDLLKFRPDAVYREVPHPVYSSFPQGRSRDLGREHLGVRTEQVILFFGFIRAYKGLLNLIRAMAQIDRDLDVSLVIGGEFYEDDQPYKAEVARLGLADRVVWHDRYIPHEEVGDFFNAADAVVLPYQSATQSGIIQIAMNYGTPIITTNVGGLAEVVKDGEMGYVVPPEDPKALAAAITRYFREGKREAFSAAVAAERERYSWNPMAEALEAFARGER
jgi:glycosyltransferase involved in cell wall biosynthesis